MNGAVAAGHPATAEAAAWVLREGGNAFDAAMAGLCAMRVGVDNSVEIWFLKDDSTLKSYQAFQRRFGNDESVLVAFTQKGGILDDAGWSLIQRVTIALEHVEGVDRVISLANVPGGSQPVRCHFKPTGSNCQKLSWFGWKG